MGLLQQADLEGLRAVVDGVLRCVGHDVDMDLETGECLDARCDPLRVRVQV